jgi:hypothetical protein
MSGAEIRGRLKCYRAAPCASAWFYEIKVVNVGYRPITISNITVEFPNGQWFANAEVTMQNTQLPVTLGDGEEAAAYFGIQNVESACRRLGYKSSCKVTPVAKDSLRTVFRGKKIKVALKK